MKIPDKKEAIKRIKRLQYRYRNYENPLEEVKEMFMAITKGYSDKDFYELLKEKPKKRFIQKSKDCYFCKNNKIIMHHMSYSPEVLIYLCKSCHNKLHFLVQEYHKQIKERNVIKNGKK